MAVTIRKGPDLAQQQDFDPEADIATQKKKKSGHTRPRPPVINLDQEGRLRVGNLLAILNVSHSTLSAGVKSGRYPAPDGRDGSFPYWMTSTIRAFLAP